MKARRARFRLAGTFDGASSATVTITTFGDVATFEVRPLGSRRVFTAELRTVARGVIYAAVRKDNPIRAGALRPHETPETKRRSRP